MGAPLPQVPIIPWQLDPAASQAEQAHREALNRFFQQLVETTELRLVSLERGGQVRAFPIALAQATVTQLTTTTVSIKFRPGKAQVAFAVNATNASATNGCPVYGDGTVWRRFDGSAI